MPSTVGDRAGGWGRPPRSVRTIPRVGGDEGRRDQAGCQARRDLWRGVASLSPLPNTRKPQLLRGNRSSNKLLKCEYSLMGVSWELRQYFREFSRPLTGSLHASKGGCRRARSPQSSALCFVGILDVTDNWAATSKGMTYCEDRKIWCCHRRGGSLERAAGLVGLRQFRPGARSPQQQAGPVQEGERPQASRPSSRRLRRRGRHPRLGRLGVGCLPRLRGVRRQRLQLLPQRHRLPVPALQELRPQRHNKQIGKAGARQNHKVHFHDSSHFSTYSQIEITACESYKGWRCGVPIHV
jgi:hypothetical protein